MRSRMVLALLILWALLGHGHSGHAQLTRVATMSTAAGMSLDVLYNLNGTIAGIVYSNTGTQPMQVEVCGAPVSLTIPAGTTDTTILFSVSIAPSSGWCARMGRQ